MKLSKPQFDKLLKDDRIILSLIGMSNVGKTYWSNKLENIGFKHINCDDLIATKLAHLLEDTDRLNIDDISKWMGQPYDERFTANQKKYLSCEKTVMENIFVRIKNQVVQNTVIDTTGSVVHASRKLCATLKRHSLVIYIRMTKNMKEEMFNKYIAEPKPVIFRDVFNQRHGESTVQALKRCYLKLLNLRDELYTGYSDIIIPNNIASEAMSANQFISLIEHSL